MNSIMTKLTSKQLQKRDAARAGTGLTQAQFATLLGVSVRTLQECEQGRREPSGSAKSLLLIALRHPEVLRELAT